jgi:hypothetical protein
MNHRRVLRGASKLCSGFMGSPCGLRLIQAGMVLVHKVLVTTSCPALCVSGKSGSICLSLRSDRMSLPSRQAVFAIAKNSDINFKQW